MLSHSIRTLSGAELTTLYGKLKALAGVPARSRITSESATRLLYNPSEIFLVVSQKRADLLKRRLPHTSSSRNPRRAWRPVTDKVGSYFVPVLSALASYTNELHYIQVKRTGNCYTFISDRKPEAEQALPGILLKH